MIIHPLNFVGGQKLALASSRLGKMFTLLKHNPCGPKREMLWLNWFKMIATGGIEFYQFSDSHSTFLFPLRKMGNIVPMGHWTFWSTFHSSQIAVWRWHTYLEDVVLIQLVIISETSYSLTTSAWELPLPLRWAEVSTYDSLVGW